VWRYGRSAHAIFVYFFLNHYRVVSARSSWIRAVTTYSTVCELFAVLGIQKVVVFDYYYLGLYIFQVIYKDLYYGPYKLSNRVYGALRKRYLVKEA
jgi:hypothetical protein